jgi:purine-nucleoside phosphorylase
MSIHIEAERGEIADIVFLPGDPLRAEFVAKTYFDSPVVYNRVRGMLGFTGTFEGKRVSVQGTGMGQPSLAIYVTELIRDYGVKRLVRIGSCGALQPEMKTGDVVLASGACTDSAMNRLRFRGMDFAPVADFELLRQAHENAAKKDVPVRVGNIFSSDSFYTDDPEQWKLWARYGVVAVEMETSALYTIAAAEGARALAMLTVSDSLVTGEKLSAEERRSSFIDMFAVALSLV